MAVSKKRVLSKVANHIETATSAGSDFADKSAKTVKDQFTGTTEDFIEQLFGASFYEKPSKKSKMGGEMRPGEFVSLSEMSVEAQMKQKAKLEKAKPERRPDILPGLDYRSEIVHGSERMSKREGREIEQQIQFIMQELKRVVDSSAILQMQFAEVSIQQAPPKAGKYYVNFFSWLLIEIRKIRMKIEDSGAWLSVMKNKKSGKGYQAMARKHGTSFTLNNERTPATQTG